jgi:glycosyltransferase involved in cell wall biosynthesis
MTKVTVIIPNYNHAQFLDQRVRSVLDQTYQDFEIIFLDDASTDGSNEIFKKYLEHPRVRKTLRNQVNTGIPFKQWNRGVSEAKGEYVWIAESDDYADVMLLETLVSLLDNNPNVGVAYCQSLAVDENNNILFSLKNWTDDIDENHWKKDFVTEGKDECERYVVLKCTIPNASAVVFRRSVYEGVGGADESFRLSGDWLLWAKMLMASDIAFTAEPLNFFRMHANTVRKNSYRSSIALQEALIIFRHIRERINISEHIQEEAFNGLLSRWVSDISKVRLGVGVHLAIYRTFRKLDRKVHKRIVMRFIKSVGRHLKWF